MCGSRAASLLALAAGFQSGLAPAPSAYYNGVSASVPAMPAYVAMPQFEQAVPAASSVSLTVPVLGAAAIVAVAAARLASTQRPVAAAAVMARQEAQDLEDGLKA